MSEWTFVNAGESQGFIPVPLLFLIYIDDIVYEPCASVRLFAGVVVGNPSTIDITLNNDLTFSCDCFVNFNATIQMLLTCLILK